MKQGRDRVQERRGIKTGKRERTAERNQGSRLRGRGASWRRWKQGIAKQELIVGLGGGGELVNTLTRNACD